MVIVGYVGGRLQEGLFTWLHGIEIHIWRPLDSWFREITARRNPNLFILTVAVILGAPREGVRGGRRLDYLFLRVPTRSESSRPLSKRRWGRAPVSWLSEPIKP